jgi:ATP-dependent DNA helicase PIF1
MHFLVKLNKFHSIYVFFLSFSDLVLTDDQLKSYALAEIEKLLRSNGSSLDKYPSMPKADNELLSSSGNKLIYGELNYDRQRLSEEHVRLMSTMTVEQRKVYDKIMKRVNENKPGVFFLYGYSVFFLKVLYSFKHR